MSDKVVKTLIRKNILPAKQVATFAPWVIEQNYIESAHVQAAARAAKRGCRIPSAIGGQAELTL